MRVSLLRNQRGITILEVLASAVVILLGLGAIFGMNAQSLQILRRSQQASAASQILQERIEILRTRPWPEVARGSAVATWWATPTESASDLADASPTETLTVAPASQPALNTPRSESFQIERKNGAVQILRDGDFRDERLLVVDLTITWREQQRTVQRSMRTIVGRAGLTRSGIFGSAFGRVARGDSPAP